MSSFGCKSQNVLLKSSIFDSSTQQKYNKYEFRKEQSQKVQFNINLIMLTKIKNFVVKHKYKIIGAISFAAAGYFLYRYMYNESEIKLSAFLEALQKQQIDQVVVEGTTVYFRSESSDWYVTLLGGFPKQALYDLLKSTPNLTFSSQQPSEVYSIALTVAGMSAFTFVALKLVSQEFKKPHAQMKIDKDPKIYQNGDKFEDFYGGEVIKEKFKEIIDFLKNNEKYSKMGARIRKGVLFYGPPGTGKTMLARALATEAGVSFIRASASEFQEMYVGIGPKRIRDIFATAKQCPNGCIIFIDEIDALGNRNNYLRDSHQTVSTINQLLSQMDGFQQNQKIVVVAATNRIDLVDKAVLRSGRFDYKVQIKLPNQEQRQGILRVILNKKLTKLQEIDEGIIHEIAQKSQNWCGADMETLVNESIYKAIKGDKNIVTGQDLYCAFQQMINLQ